MLPIILASSSTYRQELLQKLMLPFTSVSPNIEESSLDGESPGALVQRLSIEKAQAIATSYSKHLIIGCDQIACLNTNGVDQILTKPGNHATAVKQLTSCSANQVTFYTGLTLLNSQTNEIQTQLDLFTVHFRTLTLQKIENYLQREPAYDCAGSFKVEGLGITLFEKLEGKDPNSLIGLPLIQLISFFENEGVDILATRTTTVE